MLRFNLFLLTCEIPLFLSVPAAPISKGPKVRQAWSESVAVGSQASVESDASGPPTSLVSTHKQLASHLRPMSTFGCSGRSHSAGPAVPMEGAVWLFWRYKVQVNYSTLTVLKSNTKTNRVEGVSRTGYFPTLFTR